jgi:hypothetical protein
LHGGMAHLPIVPETRKQHSCCARGPPIAFISDLQRDIAIWPPDVPTASIIHFPRYGHRTFVSGHYIFDYGDKFKHSNCEVPDTWLGIRFPLSIFFTLILQLLPRCEWSLRFYSSHVLVFAQDPLCDHPSLSPLYQTYKEGWATSVSATFALARPRQ